MRLHSKVQLLSIFLLAIGIFPVAFCQDIVQLHPPMSPEIRLATPYNFSIENNGSVFIRLPDNLTADLTLHARALDDSYAPNIIAHVALTDDPLGQSKADQNNDLITLPLEVLKGKEKLHVNFQCPKDFCKFTFRADITPSFVIKSENLKILNFKDSPEQLIRVAIGEDPHNEIDHVIISAELLNVQYLTSTIHVYANLGNEPPSTGKYDFRAETLWPNSKGIIVAPGDRKYSTKNNYTILIEAEIGSMVAIRMRKYKKENTLTVGPKRLDALRGDKSIHFVVDLKANSIGDDDDLDIWFTPYSGLSRVRIAAEEFPKTDEDYKLEFSEFGEDHIKLKPFERHFLGIKTKMYITVTALRFGMSFGIRLRKNNNLIAFGEVDAGILKLAEQVNYLLYSEKMSSYNKDIIFTVNQITGITDLFIKQCETQNCEVTKEEVRDYYQGTKNISKVYPQFLVSEGDNKLKQLTLKQENEHCRFKSPELGNDEDHCLYAVAIVGKSPDAYQNNRYKLLVKRPSTIISIREGEALRDFVDYNNYKYYSFSLMSGDGVESIVFQITSLTGSSTLFVSRTEMYPSYSSEFRSDPHGKVTIKRTEANQYLQGNYYIGVYGGTYTSFLLTVILNREQWHQSGNTTVPTRSVIELTPGYSQRDVLKYGEIGYYKFKNDIPRDKNHIDINIRAIKGRVAVYVRNDGVLPSNTSYMWANTKGDGQLQIGGNITENYKPTGVYYIAVYPLLQGNNQLLDSYSYTINYVPSNEVMALESGFGFWGSISKQRPMFFKFEYGPEDGDVLITKSLDKDKVTLYISFEDWNQFPNSENYNITTRNQTATTTKISKETLEKACKFNSDVELKDCNVFISALTEESKNTRLFVTITKENQITELIDGRYGYYPLAFDTPLYFYFLPQFDDKLATIMTEAATRSVTVYANVGETLKYPTLTNYDFNSKELKRGYHGDHINEIIIREESLSKCQTRYSACVVTLGVFPDTSKQNETIHDEFPVFSLVVTSEIQQLHQGIPVQGSLEARSIKYYNLFVTNSNSTLHISVTPLSHTRVTLVIAYGASSRPTLDEGNYLMKTHLGENDLEVSLEDLQRVVPDQMNMDGEWVLGVYSQQPAQFQLQYSFEDFKIFELTSRLPYDYRISNQTKYYKYFNYNKRRDLIFRLTKEYGTANMYVNSVKPEDDIYKNLPSKTKNQWSFLSSGERGEIVIKAGNDSFCNMCYYLIAVESTDSSSGSLLARHRGDLVILRDGKPMTEKLLKNQKSSFSYFKHDQRETFDISVVAISGAVNVSVFTNRSMTEASKIRAHQVSFGRHTSIRISPDLEEFEVPSSQSLEKEYYLQVKATKDSVYTIIVSSSNTLTTLHDGMTQYAILQSNESNTYRYEIPEDVFQKALTQNLTSLNRLKFQLNVFNTYFELLREFAPNADYDKHSLLPDMEINLIADYVAEKTASHPGTVSMRFPIAPYKRYRTFNGLKNEIRSTELTFVRPELHLNPMPGMKAVSAQLEIVVNNTNDLPIQYSLVGRTKDVVFLSVGQEHLSKLPVQGEELYEVHVAQSGVLAVEVWECYGKLNFEIADSLEKVHENRWDVEVKRPSKDFLVGTVEVTPRTYYIKVKVIDGIKDEGEGLESFSLYKIQTRLYQMTDPLPYDRFFYPRNGNLQYSINHPNSQLQFYWKDVEIYEQDRKELKRTYDMEITYKLVLTKDQVLAGVISKCGIIPDEHSGYYLSNTTYHKLIHLERNVSREEERKNSGDEMLGKIYRTGELN